MADEMAVTVDPAPLRVASALSVARRALIDAGPDVAEHARPMVERYLKVSEDLTGLIDDLYRQAGLLRR